MSLREALPKIVTNELPGPKAAALLQARAQAIPHAIGSVYPCVIERGEGAMFEDVDGNIFLDWVAGVGVLNLGYSHPRLVGAAQEQCGKYFHSMMNITTHSGYLQLAQQLSQAAPVRGAEKKAFFTNSGAETVENGVKLARSVTGRPNIIVFSGAFHGRTLLTMTMTAKKAYSNGTGPFPDGIYRADYPYLYRGPHGLSEEETLAYYIERLEKIPTELSPPEQIAAVVLEPLQGEGGFIPAPIAWVQALRRFCDKHGILLLADEVQSGFARTGRLFASGYWQEADCAPDIIVTAKSIAGGLPLGAVLASRELMDAVTPGVIGGTFSGNAVACAAGIETLAVIEEEGLCQRALNIGKKARSFFERLKAEHAVVGDVRGIGAMLGVELVHDKESKQPYPELAAALVQEAARRGLIIEVAGGYGNVIRFLSPLVITDEQLAAGLSIYEAALKHCLKSI